MIKKRFFLEMAVVILMTAVLGIDAFPRWYVNGSGKGFDDPGENSAAVSLEAYVVEGAGYFLDSHAHTLLFMKKLEWGGKNGLVDAEAAPLLDSALKSMEKAHATFIELKGLADTTPYNTAVTDALRQFDYDAFRAAYGIEDKTFDRVREYLGKGDIRSVYGDIVTDTGTIIELLNRVKDRVDAGVFPPNREVWMLDRAYSDSQRFGQYVSRVFDALETVD
jgi:hypothetical protein